MYCLRLSLYFLLSFYLETLDAAWDYLGMLRMHIMEMILLLLVPATLGMTLKRVIGAPTAAYGVATLMLVNLPFHRLAVRCTQLGFNGQKSQGISYHS